MRDLYLVQRDGIYCVHGSINNRRIRVSARTSDAAKAHLFLEDMRREYIGGWRDGYDSPDVTWKLVAGLICNRHRHSSKARGIPFQLKPADVFLLMQATDFRCAVSGIPFSKKAERDGRVDPWAASIDRIENRHGYFKENVRVVCVAANMAMNQFGFDTLLRLSNGVVRSASAIWPEELTQNQTNKNVVSMQGVERA